MSSAARTETDREFVVRHVDYRLPDKDRKLTARQERTLYYMADGFGVQTPTELDRINGGYDWSHFRDSSEEAFEQMARQIRVWLGLPQPEGRKSACDLLRDLRSAQTNFELNPSADNFASVAQAMVAYQQRIKG